MSDPYLDDRIHHRELTTTTFVTVLSVPTPCRTCRYEVTRKLAALPGVALIWPEGQCVRVVGSVPSQRLVDEASAASAVGSRVLSVHPLWDVTTHAQCSHPVRRHAVTLLVVGEEITRRLPFDSQASFMDVWLHHIMPYAISLSPHYENTGPGTGTGTGAVAAVAQREGASANPSPRGVGHFRLLWPPSGCGCACCHAMRHEPHFFTRSEAARGLIFALRDGCDVVRVAGCCTWHAATLPPLPAGRFQVSANLFIGGNYSRCPSEFRFSSGFVCHECADSHHRRSERSCALRISKESGDTDSRGTPTPIDGTVLLGELDVADDCEGLTVEWTTHRRNEFELRSLVFNRVQAVTGLPSMQAATSRCVQHVRRCIACCLRASDPRPHITQAVLRLCLPSVQ